MNIKYVYIYIIFKITETYMYLLLKLDYNHIREYYCFYFVLVKLFYIKTIIYCSIIYF